jgi:hypothetical protein
VKNASRFTTFELDARLVGLKLGSMEGAPDIGEVSGLAEVRTGAAE